MQVIDISEHQKPELFKWDQLPKSVTGVICRATYGVRRDKAVEAHVKAARAKGYQVGVYHFFRQQQGLEEQWDAFTATMDVLNIRAGDILPVIDLEWNEQYDGKVNTKLHNTNGRAMVERVRDEFGAAMIYLAPGFYQLLGSPAWMLEHEWWIAHYVKGEPWCPWKDWAIHQYGLDKTAAYPTAIDGNNAKRIPMALKSPVWEQDELVVLPVDHGEQHYPTNPAPALLPVNLRDKIRQAKSLLDEVLVEIGA